MASFGGAREICGYCKCLRAALTFHHLDPATKRFSIAGGHSRSWSALVREASRCTLPCMNCHAEAEGGAVKAPIAIRRGIDGAIHTVGPPEPPPPGRALAP